jgi:galactarate dehydratase
VIGLEHTYGCGVAIDAPDAIVPIRTLRNIALNPNFGGTAMVVSLGCEKLQPERLMPPGTIPIQTGAGEVQVGVVCLQDDKHVGFASMIDSIMAMAETHLQTSMPASARRCPYRNWWWACSAAAAMRSPA